MVESYLQKTLASTESPPHPYTNNQYKAIETASRHLLHLKP